MTPKLKQVINECYAIVEAYGASPLAEYNFVPLLNSLKEYNAVRFYDAFASGQKKKHSHDP